MDSLVTVCITTYNRMDLLPKTLRSILDQTYKNIEVIIVDDCSTDGTEELILTSLLKQDSRIRYIPHKNNKGLASARNTAIFNAKGVYFTFCDDDDEWDLNFLNLFVDAAKGYDDEYVFCASSISNKISVFGIESSLKKLLILGYTPPVASQFYITTTLKRVGGYDKNITSGVDHDLWLNLASNNSKIFWLNQNLAITNQVESVDRITFNEEKRIKGIEASLEIWRKRMKNSFNVVFFNCLEKNYKYNSHKKFMRSSLKNKSYVQFLLHLYKLPKYLFLLDIKRYIANRLNGEIILKFPVFFSCGKEASITDLELKLLEVEVIPPEK
jgi:glycosyltransferase involved in cell wall biosynthesis